MISRTAHLLKQRADIFRRTQVSDGQGGYTYTFGAVKVNQKCKIDQASASEQMEAEQAGSTHTHSIYMEYGQNVRRGDEIRRLGKSYRVGKVVQPSTPGVYYKAECEELQQEGEVV